MIIMIIISIIMLTIIMLTIISSSLKAGVKVPQAAVPRFAW